MKTVMVRCKVKQDRAAENETYIRKVFDEPKANGPAGLRDVSFQQDDGLTFVHSASIETKDGTNPLSQSQAFMAFQEGIKDRCQVLPVAVEVRQIGSCRLLGD